MGGKEPSWATNARVNGVAGRVLRKNRPIFQNIVFDLFWGFWRRLEQLEEPGLMRGESKETRKRKRKEEIKEQVVGQWELDKDPP